MTNHMLLTREMFNYLNERDSRMLSILCCMNVVGILEPNRRITLYKNRWTLETNCSLFRWKQLIEKE